MTLSPLSPTGLTVAPFANVSVAGEAIPIVSLRDIVRTIFRHMVPILVIIGMAVSGAFVYLMMTPPTYTAYTKMLVRVGREKLVPLSVGSEPSSNFVFTERTENTNDEIEIMRNPHVMSLVFPQLKARYLEMAAAGANQPPPATLFEWLKYGMREVRHSLSAAGRWTLEMMREPLILIGLSHRMTDDEKLGALFQASLGVDFIKETNIILLSFAWSGPDFAAFALNAFAETYRREHQRVLSDVPGAVGFYTIQAERTESSLKEINREIDDYLAASGVTDPVSEKQMALTLTSSLERQHSDARVAEEQTRNRLVGYQKKFDETSDWLETPGVPNVMLSGLADIDARHNEILTRRAALVSELRPTAREVRDLDAQIAELRQAKLRALTNYLNDRLAAEVEEQRVVGERLAEQRRRFERLNVISTHYVGLVDRRDQLLGQLKVYRKQIEELGVRHALNDRGYANVAMLSDAVASDLPTGPRKSLIMGLALGFGVLFAAAFVILSEFFSRSFANERDVTRVLGLRLVAAVPELGLRSRLPG